MKKSKIKKENYFSDLEALILEGLTDGPIIGTGIPEVIIDHENCMEDFGTPFHKKTVVFYHE